MLQKKKVKSVTGRHENDTADARSTADETNIASPLQGRVEITRPNDVNLDELKSALSSSLSIEPRDVNITDVHPGALVVDFQVTNARQLYADNSAMAQQLSSDVSLCARLSNTIMYAKEKNLGFAVKGGIQHSDFTFLKDSGVFALIDEALVRIAREKPVNPIGAFAEIVCPSVFERSRKEYAADLEKMRMVQGELQHRAELGTVEGLRHLLARAEEERQSAESRYTQAQKLQDELQQQLDAITASLSARDDERDSLREELQRMQNECVRLEAVQAQLETKIRGDDSERGELLDALHAAQRKLEVLEEMKANCGMVRDGTEPHQDREVERLTLELRLARIYREKGAQGPNRENEESRLQLAEAALRQRTMQLHESMRETREAHRRIHELESVGCAN